MAEGKPTLHHLNNSQSQFILWLLEELEIPYNLELYERETSGRNKGRAPESMKKTHPLGKSPQLVTPEGRVIIEQSAISLYLLQKYDTAGRFKGDSATGNDDIRDEMISSFARTSLYPIIISTLMFDLLRHMSPFFLRPFTGGLFYMINKAFLGKEREVMMTYLETELGDQDYFMGSSPGRADFMALWPVDFGTQLGYVDLKSYPKVQQWSERCKARDGWKRAMEKGNGYDMKLPT